MAGSHLVDRWLEAHEQDLWTSGITGVAGRAPSLAGRPAATWVSFQTSGSVGRAVLWGSGRCQLNATSSDGSRLCAEERTVTTTAQLDDALVMLTGHLRLPARG